MWSRACALSSEGILLFIWGLKSSGRPHLGPLQRLQWFQSGAATQTPILFSRKLSVCRQRSLKSLRENWFYYFPALFFEGGMEEWSGREWLFEDLYKNLKVNLFSSGLGQTDSCMFLSDRVGGKAVLFKTLENKLDLPIPNEADTALANASGDQSSWDSRGNSLTLMKVCKGDDKLGWKNHFKTTCDPFCFLPAAPPHGTITQRKPQ